MADTRRKFCQLTLPDSPHTVAGPSHTHSHTGTQIAHWLCKQKQKWRHQWPPCPMVMMMAMMMIIAREAAFGGCYEIIDFVGRKGRCRIIFPHVFAPLSMSRAPSINIGPVQRFSFCFGAHESRWVTSAHRCGSHRQDLIAQ